MEIKGNERKCKQRNINHFAPQLHYDMQYNYDYQDANNILYLLQFTV